MGKDRRSNQRRAAKNRQRTRSAKHRNGAPHVPQDTAQPPRQDVPWTIWTEELGLLGAAADGTFSVRLEDGDATASSSSTPTAS